MQRRCSGVLRSRRPPCEVSRASPASVRAGERRDLPLTKRWLPTVGATPSLLLRGAIGIWRSAAFRISWTHPLPLPDDLIACDSPTGLRLLAESAFAANYNSLSGNFESQSHPASCGVASCVVVLNALRGSHPRLTQSTFFTRTTGKKQVRGWLRIMFLKMTFPGMPLAQLAAWLRAHGAEATAFYASDVSLDSFRAMAKQSLSTEGEFMLVNYQRASLGQQAMAHISPLAAYHAGMDRLLVLDVARYKYPPVWVPTERLWRAMNTVADKTSGKTRGFVLVRGARFG
ncbi:MAG TPA: phytochelatin synthase family protein [Burkholderiales bacterium]|nr:phytochelatin synthase family protein [Burkholderiales bacterium]